MILLHIIKSFSVGNIILVYMYDSTCTCEVSSGHWTTYWRPFPTRSQTWPKMQSVRDQHYSVKCIIIQYITWTRSLKRIRWKLTARNLNEVSTRLTIGCIAFVYLHSQSRELQIMDRCHEKSLNNFKTMILQRSWSILASIQAKFHLCNSIETYRDKTIHLRHFWQQQLSLPSFLHNVQ